jgi:hypothetical protein
MQAAYLSPYLYLFQYFPTFYNIFSHFIAWFSVLMVAIRSSAEPDVLAAYIIALLKNDKNTEELKEQCISNLTDFLKDGILLILFICVMSTLLTFLLVLSSRNQAFC